MSANDPDTFMENGGYHFEEEFEMNLLRTRAIVKLAGGWQSVVMSPQLCHSHCTRRHYYELASMELAPNYLAPSESPLARISIWPPRMGDRTLAVPRAMKEKKE